MPDMSHLWQRFVLALTLLFGLAVGVAATVFGYSNTQAVDLRFSVLHLNGVPLWAVGLVPVALVIAAGTLYHWWNSLHHFTEHMRHRRRVRELEAEVASLKSHLDKFLDMPDGTTTTTTTTAATPVATVADAAPMPPLTETEIVATADATPETTASNGNGKSSKKKGRTAAPDAASSVAGDESGDAAPADAKVEDEMTSSPFASTSGS